MRPNKSIYQVRYYKYIRKLRIRKKGLEEAFYNSGACSRVKLKMFNKLEYAQALLNGRVHISYAGCYENKDDVRSDKLESKIPYAMFCYFDTRSHSKELSHFAVLKNYSEHLIDTFNNDYLANKKNIMKVDMA